jgi:hypothetical protein
MTSAVIGRDAEIQTLNEFLATDYPEFLAIYACHLWKTSRREDFFNSEIF